MMKRILFFLPVLLVILTGGFLLWGLDPDRDPSAIPSVLISQPVPQFDLPAVEGLDLPGFGSDELEQAGEVVLVNVFASWCVPCRAEHAVLTRMVRETGVVLMGLNYKDKPADITVWLDNLGNPYDRVGSDLDGRAGIEWGISGVPETFIIGADGLVAYRYVGPIVGPKAEAEFLTALEQAQQAQAEAEAGV
jgi:cytochrome c biogenesis protein CcmG, thiol:disulfide interchange protein DsbE